MSQVPHDQGEELALSKPSSNLHRLEDALNKIDIREKYRAQTRSPSDGEDVRWYFSKACLSLGETAASVLSTEVVGKSDYLRFSVNDSLALEAAFLEQEEELLSSWWKEYAECSKGPLSVAGRGESSVPKSDTERLLTAADGESSPGSTTYDSNIHQQDGSELYESDEVIGVPVKGGLYEADLFRRRCYPVYWIGNHRRVLRGHWFAQKGGLDWLPLREDISEQLEFAYRSKIWHRRTFQPSGLFAARINLQGNIQGLHALFMGEDDTWQALLDTDASAISLVLGLKGSGIKLRRGFSPSQSLQPSQDELRQRHEEEMDDYYSQVPVRHLLFMVHGIGQRLENANFVDDVDHFRNVASTLAEHHLTSYQRNSQRVLYIPCQWRRGLKLRGEEAVESCTLEGVRALRTILSATVHDVLYYMSPVYCQDIIDSVTGQLNKLYCKFIKRNPGYDGKVSIFGHSLGSVLSYDILCHQNNLVSSFPISQIDENLQKTQVSRNQAGGSEKVKRSSEHLSGENVCDIETSQDAPVNFTEQRKDMGEINALRDEVARLKEKLMALEGHHTIKQEEEILEHHRKHFDGSAETTLCPRISDEEEIKPVSSVHEKHSLSDGQESRLFSAEAQEKKLCDVAAEAYASCAPALIGSAGSETLPDDQPKGTLNTRSKSRKRYTPYIEYTKLAFEVDTFFAVGSPLGVFLSLRNVRLGNGSGKDYWEDDRIDEEMPACKRMLNIFHPFDPVAYRIEPLVCKEYLQKRPVFVPYHKGGKRLHIGMQEFTEDLSARSKAFVHSISTVGDRVVKVFSTANPPHKDDDEHDMRAPKERTYGSFILEKLTGDMDGRIDYMLQDATFEHQYLQAISSHTSYWQDPDTALFIIKHLYCDIPKESPTKKLEVVSESVDEEHASPEPNLLLNQNDIAAELALTFSSKKSMTVVKPDGDNTSKISGAKV